MARLLKEGAIMLQNTCPSCNTPLFKLRSGEVICPSCGQRYIIVSSDEEELAARINVTISSLERSIVKKLNELIILLSKTKDLDDLNNVSRSISGLLKILIDTRTIRKGLSYAEKD
ncbi:hypothetical protein DRJ16_03880 [Candidatus Woesearchaeota archaeon]|nr:MAG: hypothetical protein DRJ16_03880 [Candidatus Woesearchaeota archaeon]